MTMRVGTFAMNERLLDAALRTQAKTAELGIQQASGLVSMDYGGLGAVSKGVINLEVSVARAQSYADAATSANGRIETMYAACSSMTDLLTEMRSQISGATGNVDGNGAGLTATARELLEEFASLLNTQYEGRYLFAGTRTDTPPIDISSTTYPAASSPSTADLSYFTGDSSKTSVRIADDQTVQYGITADEPAFEKALRALNLIRNMTVSPIDSDTLNEAQDLVIESLDGVLALQSGLSLDSATMERAVSHQQDYVDFAQTLTSNLRAVDVAAVAAQMSTYQAQLEASYSAIGRIQSLSLLDYLR